MNFGMSFSISARNTVGILIMIAFVLQVVLHSIVSSMMLIFLFHEHFLHLYVLFVFNSVLQFSVYKCLASRALWLYQVVCVRSFPYGDAHGVMLNPECKVSYHLFPNPEVLFYNSEMRTHLQKGKVALRHGMKALNQPAPILAFLKGPFLPKLFFIIKILIS